MMDAAGFITALIVHYPFRHDTPEKQASWLRSMARELREFESSVLEEAATLIVHTRKRRDFPLASECREACESVRRRHQIAAKAQTLPAFAETKPNSDWSTERIKLAYDLLPTEMGRQADREGWIGTFFNFCRQHARLPKSPAEINLCKKQAKEFDSAYAQCVSGGFPQAYSLEKLGASMLAKREKYGAIARGEIR